MQQTTIYFRVENLYSLFSLAAPTTERWAPDSKIWTPTRSSFRPPKHLLFCAHYTALWIWKNVWNVKERGDWNISQRSNEGLKGCRVLCRENSTTSSLPLNRQTKGADELPRHIEPRRQETII